MRESMNELTSTHRFNVVHELRVSYVHKQKTGIVLLIWKYRHRHYIYRKKLTLTHTSRTPSVSWALPPNPSAVFNSCVQSGHLSHQNSKTLMLRYQFVITDPKKYEQIDKQIEIQRGSLTVCELRPQAEEE